MKYTSVSHCAGDKALPASLRKEIVDAIHAVSVKPTKGAAAALRAAVLAGLKSYGWSGEVAVSQTSDITITSMKDEIGLCLQTGNMARMYADLIKLQTLYLDNAIKAAVIIVPAQPVAALLGSNVAQATRLERELAIFRKAYHVPTVLFALE